MNQKKRFMITEKWLFRGYLVWVAITIGLLTLVATIGSEIKELVNALSGFFVLLLFVPIGLFITAIVRIIIYLVRFKGQPEKPTIWRSIVTLLTSPVMEVFYFIFLFAALLSISSCTYNG
jgi:hypothetical protein